MNDIFWQFALGLIAVLSLVINLSLLSDINDLKKERDKLKKELKKQISRFLNIKD